MRLRIGSWALSKRFQQQRVVFLRSKTCHANKKNVFLAETGPRPPLFPRCLWRGIEASRNAVRNHAAPLNSVKALHACCYFLRDCYRYNSVVECVALNPARPGFNLALGEVVDRVQYRRAFQKQQKWQRVPKHVQMGVNNVGLVVFENRVQSGVNAVIESRMFAQVSNFNAGLIEQTVEVASEALGERNDNWFIPLAVQSSNDMDRHALGSARAQHRNDMDYLDLVHLGVCWLLRCFRSNQELTRRATFKIRDENATLMMRTTKRGSIPTRLPPLGHAAALRH